MNLGKFCRKLRSRSREPFGCGAGASLRALRLHLNDGNAVAAVATMSSTTSDLYIAAVLNSTMEKSSEVADLAVWRERARWSPKIGSRSLHVEKSWALATQKENFKIFALCKTFFSDAVRLLGLTGWSGDLAMIQVSKLRCCSGKDDTIWRWLASGERFAYAADWSKQVSKSWLSRGLFLKSWFRSIWLSQCWQSARAVEVRRAAKVTI